MCEVAGLYHKNKAESNPNRPSQHTVLRLAELHTHKHSNLTTKFMTVRSGSTLLMCVFKVRNMDSPRLSVAHESYNTQSRRKRNGRAQVTSRELCADRQ